MWQEPKVAERLKALIRVAITHPDAAEGVSAMLQRSVLGPLTDALGDDEAELRAGLVGAQLVGLALVRLVVPFPPITDASIDELVEAVSPTIDRYLTGTLGEQHADGPASQP